MIGEGGGTKTWHGWSAGKVTALQCSFTSSVRLIKLMIAISFWLHVSHDR